MSTIESHSIEKNRVEIFTLLTVRSEVADICLTRDKSAYFHWSNVPPFSNCVPPAMDAVAVRIMDRNPGGAQEEKLCQHDYDEDHEEDTLQMAIALSLQEEGGNMDLQKRKQ